MVQVSLKSVKQKFIRILACMDTPYTVGLTIDIGTMNYIEHAKMIEPIS